MSNIYSKKDRKKLHFAMKYARMTTEKTPASDNAADH